MKRFESVFLKMFLFSLPVILLVAITTYVIDRMAYNIAFFHHEKWDRTGYVSGISGEYIPIEARIVTLADVYNALGTERPYKDPFPEEKTDSIIKEGRATHFNPALVDLYFTIKGKILEIKDAETPL